MGQQQLLLLVLTIVIVGIAVVAGLATFEENRRKSQMDQVYPLMMDLAAKAQVWKLTPAQFGGGENGDPADYSEFTLSKIGLVATETPGSSEVILRREFACFKIIPGADRLDINALDVDCEGGSWWAKLRVTGSTPDDLEFRFSNDGSAISDNGV